MMLFVCPQIQTDQGTLDGYLLVEGRQIKAVEPGPIPASLDGVPRVDLPGARLLPGLIDLHIHGAGGWSVEGADRAGLQRLASYLAAYGVTGFLATASARPLEELEALARATREAMVDQKRGDVLEGEGDHTPGAEVLGLHLEGPFLNPAQKGAMTVANFRAPSISDLERLLVAAAGALRRVTLAPEVQGAEALTRYLVSQGVLVAGGHTDATYAETQAGIEAGVRLANHTYNAMRGLHHREPGALGAYLLDERVTCEVICDLRHVHPAALELLLRVAGPSRVALISDAVPAAGMAPGHYQIYGRDLHVDEEGFAKLANGTLAGSTRLMLHGLRNLVEELGVAWPAAVEMASLVPARLLGLAHRKGSLAPGKDADLVVIDQHWQVAWTVVGGRVVRTPDDPMPEPNPLFAAAQQ